MAHIEWLTIAEARAYLKVSRQTFWNLRATGKINYTRIGSLVRVDKAELDAYLISQYASRRDVPSGPTARSVAAHRRRRPTAA